MRKTLSLLFGGIALFAVVAQYYLMVENRTVPVAEATIRFFSYFTILTNTLVAVYFIAQVLRSGNKLPGRSGTLTALTTYITIVGLVYQIVLRQLWEPQGLQMVVDELLHSCVPVLVIIFWYCFENRAGLAYSKIVPWLIYPLVYLFYILARGHLSGFYPYPFVDVTALGYPKVFLNSAVLLLIFVAFAALFVKIGRATKNKQ